MARRSGPPRILVTGGGSGGHAIPALTVARALAARGAEVVCVGSAAGVERDLFVAAGFRYNAIATGRFRRYLTWRHLVDPFRVLAGFAQSLGIVRRERPDAAFGTGGFVSVPPLAACAMLGVPCAIHEQTVASGLANRMAARFARRVLLAHPDSAVAFPAARTRVVGMPVRPEMLAPAPPLGPLFGLPGDGRPVLFVTGGAQGSRALNAALAGALPRLLARFHVIHQYGTVADAPPPREAGVKDGAYVARPFFRDEMPALLRGAALLVGRSGAGTVMDCAIAGLPAIFVPLPHATKDEQTRNARLLADRDGAIILPERDLASDRLADLALELLDSGRLDAMRVLIAAAGFRDATPEIVDELLALARPGNGAAAARP